MTNHLILRKTQWLLAVFSFSVGVFQSGAEPLQVYTCFCMSKCDPGWDRENISDGWKMTSYPVFSTDLELCRQDMEVALGESGLCMGEITISECNIGPVKGPRLAVERDPGNINVYDGFDLENQQPKLDFEITPYFNGEMRVALGDVNNDGIADLITIPGPGGGSHVKVRDGSKEQEVIIADFMAYDPVIQSGFFVASGDVNGDGYDDIVTGPDAGPGIGTHVKVFSGKHLPEKFVLQSFTAYEGFFGGVRVAVGDVIGTGDAAQVITAPGPGGGPHIRVWEGGTSTFEFMAYAPVFVGGVHLATGNFDNDRGLEIITAPGAGGGPNVRVFQHNGQKIRDFMARDPGDDNYYNGLTVGSADVNNDGKTDILTVDAGNWLEVFSGTDPAPTYEKSIFYWQGARRSIAGYNYEVIAVE